MIEYFANLAVVETFLYGDDKIGRDVELVEMGKGTRSHLSQIGPSQFLQRRRLKTIELQIHFNSWHVAR